jgi:tRNA threonylcarbamoyl adenosine modification protein (Sua5/YciO/YrdC/YwlC family)
VSLSFQVDPARPEDAEGALAAATEALVQGSLVVFPTETVYGIAARPDVRAATARVFEAKRRPARLTLPVLVRSSEVAWRYGQQTKSATLAAERFWPGPLTLIFERTAASKSWDLGEENRTIGLRVPDHPIAQLLLRRTDALAATSANLSGEGPLDEPEALHSAFGDGVAVYLFLPPDVRPPSGTSSTVADVTGDVVNILRPGPISERDLRRALRGPP